MKRLDLTDAEFDQVEFMTNHFRAIRQGGYEWPVLVSLTTKLKQVAGRASGGQKETDMTPATRTITPKRRTAVQPPKPFDSEDEQVVDDPEDEDEDEQLEEQAAPRRTAAKAASKTPAAKSTSKPAAKKAAPKSEAPAVKAVKKAPKPTEEPLSGEELIERKRLAGAGRSQEPGTTFGSRWTDEERKELKKLCEGLSGADAAAAFVKKYPHRTVQGALYQISRNGY